MYKKEITLIQPRHIYAPDFKIETLGHVYMPTSLLGAASILLKAGFEVLVLDENIEPYSFKDNIVGINLLGAPYIPSALRFKEILEKKYNHNYQLLLGGQIISGFSSNQFERLFGRNVINGNEKRKIAMHFDLDVNNIMDIENLSLIPAYSKLNDNYMRLYLSNEFSFYLSQGCKYSCSFCSAQRSRKNPISKKFEKVNERYRDIEIAYHDLDYLIERAKKFNITKLDIYLSNLDVFQTPEKIKLFAEKILILRNKHSSFNINMRGLSTVKSFLNAHKEHKYTLSLLKEVGFYRVGFGIDGAAPQIWKKTRKPQTKSECIKAIDLAKKVYGFVPETLMVFGYNEIEDRESLYLAFEFTKSMYENYNALPRPHVAKDIVPGNDGWGNNSEVVNKFISNPILFQNLDYTALPSPYTHNDEKFRALVSEFYIKICDLPSALTQYVKPELPNLSVEALNKIKEFNLRKYDI